EDDLPTSVVDTDLQLDGSLVLAGSTGAPIVVDPLVVLELDAAWDERCAVHGFLRDDTGQGLADAEVDLGDEGYPEDDPARLLGRTPTGANGSFRLAFRAPALRGPILLHAWGNELARGLGRDTNGAAASVRVPAASADLRLTPAELREDRPLVL